MPTATTDHLPTDASGSGVASDKASYGSSTLSSTSPTSPDGISPSQDLLSPLPRLRVNEGWQSPSPSSPSIDVSHKARYGSGPPSPIMKGMQEGGYVALPWPKGSTRESWDGEEKPAKARADSKLQAVAEQSELTADRKKDLRESDDIKQLKNNRVIVVDIDSVFPKADPTSSVAENGGHRDIATAGGLAESLQQIRALGHPIHLVTSEPASARDHVIEWLRKQGITIGLGDAGLIAHVWCSDSEEATKISSMGKLQVLRAVSASLFITDNAEDVNMIEESIPHVQCLFLSNPIKFDGLPRPQQPNEAHSTVGEEGAAAEDTYRSHMAQNWESIVTWIEEWDAVDAKH